MSDRFLVVKDNGSSGLSFSRESVNNMRDSIGLSEMAQPNLKAFISTEGAIHAESGTDYNTDAVRAAYKRSEYLFTAKGTKICARKMRAITSVAVIAVYNENKEFDSGNSLLGGGTTADRNRTFVMPYDGYVRFCSLNSAIDNTAVENVSGKKELNILVFGNSFSQDSWAYVPPVLNELMPDCFITYCVNYIGSTGISDQIAAYRDGTAYTWCNLWKPEVGAWTRYAGGGSNEKTFDEVLAFADHWDVIYVQGHGNVTSIETFAENNVGPGREFLRILQKEIQNPFIYLTGQWLATGTSGEGVFGETVFESMTECMEYLKANLGVNDVVRIGTAIQNARANAVLDDLGHYGDVNTGTEEDPVWVHENPGHLLFNNHQQSGLPALLSAYMIVLKLLHIFGRDGVSIYNSTFVPTTENCIAINAYKAAGMVTPLPMTHGESVGVDDGEGNILWNNIRAAQEIAILAHNNPGVMTDCSGVIVSAPEPTEPLE